MEFPTTTLALITIIAVSGLIGVVAIDIIIPHQDAEANGCQFPVLPYNVSQKRCSWHWWNFFFLIMDLKLRETMIFDKTV